VDSAFTAQRFVADALPELHTPLAALRGRVDVMRRVLQVEPAEADRLATTVGASWRGSADWSPTCWCSLD
jgi:hypothetical protein